MQKLTKQILLKISPELNKSIDVAFSQYLKNTGEYITKAEFIRRAVESGYQTLIGGK